MSNPSDPWADLDVIDLPLVYDDRFSHAEQQFSSDWTFNKGIKATLIDFTLTLEKRYPDLQFVWQRESAERLDHLFAHPPHRPGRWVRLLTLDWSKQKWPSVRGPGSNVTFVVEPYVNGGKHPFGAMKIMVEALTALYRDEKGMQAQLLGLNSAKQPNFQVNHYFSDPEGKTPGARRLGVHPTLVLPLQPFSSARNNCFTPEVNGAALVWAQAKIGAEVPYPAAVHTRQGPQMERRYLVLDGDLLDIPTPPLRFPGDSPSYPRVSSGYLVEYRETDVGVPPKTCILLEKPVLGYPLSVLR